MGGVSAGFPAIRAALRLARRDAWRNKGRSALIAVMVALPVFAGGAVSVLYRSDQRDPQDVVRVSAGMQAQAAITSTAPGEVVVQSIDGSQSSWSGGDGSATSGTNSSTAALNLEQWQSKVESVISPRDRIVVDSQLRSGRTVRIGDRYLNADLREFDYSASGVRGLVDQVSGHRPSQPGEVVITQYLAKHKGLRIGDQLKLATSPDGALQGVTVVGIVGGIALINDAQVIGLPGTSIAPPANASADSATTRTLYITGPDPVTWDQVLNINQFGGTVTSRAVVAHPPSSDRVPYDQQDFGDSSVRASTLGIVVVVIGLMLLQIALLAGPAIAVGARRNQRGLAIMAAAGAERKHLRAVVLAASAVIGLVSCLVAAGLGAGVGAIAVLLLRHYLDAQLVRIDVHPLDLLGLALVGGATTVAAALIPARQAARLDVVATLTGRRGQLPPRLRVPVVGLILTILGATVAYRSAHWRHPFITVLALALTEIGLVMAVGAVVVLAAKAAVRLPFAPRFALRDAARQRGRTAPAVAAVLAAIAGGTAALVYVSAQSQHDQRIYTPSGQLGMVMVHPDRSGDIRQNLAREEAAIRRTLPIDRVVSVLGTATPDGSYSSVEVERPAANLCPFDDAVPVPADQLKRLRADPRCLPASKPEDISFEGGDLFDDGSALSILTGVNSPSDAAALRAGKVLVFDPLLLGPDGTVHLESNNDQGTTIRGVVLPGQLSTTRPRLANSVYPLSAAKALGVKLVPQGLLASTTRLPTSAEEDKASAALSDVGPNASLSIERGYQDNYRIGLLALVVAAGLVTLGGTFTAVGLAAAESRADVATLAAVGASPGVRRRLAASQAGVIAGLGSALGVLSGLLAGWVLVRMQQPGQNRPFVPDPLSFISDPWQMVFPWSYLLAIGVGVPLVAVGIGFLSTRSRLPMVRRLGQ